MAFKGFDKVGGLKYEQKVFQCKRCDNECDVTQVNADGRMMYHGDICGRYEDAETSGADSGENLFGLRENILESYAHKSRAGRISVGIPRAGMFYELFPFWSGFFETLNMNLVPSNKTNKKIISSGLELATADFCFPFKVAFGHIADLQDKVDWVFAPDIIETYRSQFSEAGEARDTGWDRSRACPYLQNFGPVIARNVASDYINPVLDFRDSKRKMTRDLKKALKAGGVYAGRIEAVLCKLAEGKPVEALRLLKDPIRNALDAGERAYLDFKKQLRSEGQRALEKLEDKSKGVVVVARPYSAFDEEMNLRLAKKIASYGFVPLPMDFLPLPERDLSQVWGNEFSIQGQLILNAAEVTRELGLNAVFVDHFACGPNSFIKHEFERQIGKPYLTLQIDEHTADAGLVTRLEAFLDSVGGNDGRV